MLPQWSGALEGGIVSYFHSLDSQLYSNVFRWQCHRDPDMPYSCSLQDPCSHRGCGERAGKVLVSLWKSTGRGSYGVVSLLQKISMCPFHLTLVEYLLNKAFCCGKVFWAVSIHVESSLSEFCCSWRCVSYCSFIWCYKKRDISNDWKYFLHTRGGHSKSLDTSSLLTPVHFCGRPFLSVLLPQSVAPADGPSQSGGNSVWPLAGL